MFNRHFIFLLLLVAVTAGPAVYFSDSWKKGTSLENAGYAITTEAGDDVLVLRPAIIDLDITAPDTRTPGRSRRVSATRHAARIR